MLLFCPFTDEEMETQKGLREQPASGQSGRARIQTSFGPGVLSLHHDGTSN